MGIKLKRKEHHMQLKVSSVVLGAAVVLVSSSSMFGAQQPQLQQENAQLRQQLLNLQLKTDDLDNKFLILKTQHEGTLKTNEGLATAIAERQTSLTTLKTEHDTQTIKLQNLQAAKDQDDIKITDLTKSVAQLRRSSSVWFSSFLAILVVAGIQGFIIWHNEYEDSEDPDLESNDDERTSTTSPQPPECNPQENNENENSENAEQPSETVDAPILVAEDVQIQPEEVSQENTADERLAVEQVEQSGQPLTNDEMIKKFTHNLMENFEAN
jgi:hypothetical protein